MHNNAFPVTICKWLFCLAIACTPWFLPTPEGLTPAGWLYGGIFVAVLAGFFLAPAPPALVTLLGLLAAVFLRIGSPGSDTALPFVNSAPEVLGWAFSGFASPLVWLVFGVFIIGTAFEKTGLCVRIGYLLLRCTGKKILHLGYAVVLAETLLALLMPSSTARSCGVVRPMLMGIPLLCKSSPQHAPSTAAYLGWVAFSGSCIASSLFLTAFIPNLIALDMLQLAQLPLPDWKTWFFAIAPGGIIMLCITPLLAYWLFPPDQKELEILPHQDDGNYPIPALRRRQQIGLLICFLLALVAWVAGEPYGITAPAVALLLPLLLVIVGILEWRDVMGNAAVWNTVIWLGAMLSLASGLDNTGVLDWILHPAMQTAGYFTPNICMIILVIVFFFFRYCMAGAETYAAVVLPLFLAAGSGLAGKAVDAAQFGLALALLTGFSGVLTPYATGQGMIWFSNGFIRHGEFWFSGFISGIVYLAIFLIIVMPWIYFSGIVS